MNTTGINSEGHLTIGGCDTVSLAQKYGTPLYVMDEDAIRKACRRYKAAIDRFYNGNGLPIYAGKAFFCLEMCRIIAAEGLGLDVVSAGELHIAIKARFPGERIFFHGNNKTPEEIGMALDYKVGRFMVDNITELELLNRMAKAAGTTVDIMLRLKPGVDAHTHDYIRTGQIDSKFGFAIETGEAYYAVKQAVSYDAVRLVGIHCHIGSQIFEGEPFKLAAKTMLDFMAKVESEMKTSITELNLGGGFGIKYVDSDDPNEYEEYISEVSEVIHSLCEENRRPVPKVYVEPGRSIAGPAGLTLYTVGAVKHIPNIRTYVSVDGGMTDNPRYALYKSNYTVLVANKAMEPANFTATIAGKCCESGDLIQENSLIQEPEPGDILAVLATGAYNYSMASNYNCIPKPAMVMVKDGESRVIIKRESLDDVMKNQL